MNSLSGNTSLFATGPLNKVLCSSIHFIRCTGEMFAIDSSSLDALISALDFSDPRGRPPADGQVTDPLATRRHGALQRLAPAGVKQPLRREAIAVGAGANRGR